MAPMRQVEWIAMAGIAALVSAIALTVSGIALGIAVARWGRFPAVDDPAGQLVYAVAHPSFLPFTYGLITLGALLLPAVAGGLYLVLSPGRPTVARLAAGAGCAGAFLVALGAGGQAVRWATIVYAATPLTRAAVVAVREMAFGPLSVAEALGYFVLAAWIVASGVMLWPLGRDVRALAAVGVLAGLATPFAQPALALWAFVAGIWLLSPGPRLALLRSIAAARPPL